jgi:hypothetical protein
MLPAAFHDPPLHRNDHPDTGGGSRDQDDAQGEKQ